MSRVITFSRTFPSYHPKAGRPTWFVEKILKSQPGWGSIIDNQTMPDLVSDFALADCKPKLHTIRAGHRWKAGDKFSPRVWSGKPYHSPQIIIAPDMEVKKTWYFKIVDGFILVNGVPMRNCDVEKIAANDGLSLEDFLAWFKYPQPFDGQIIAWDENVNY